MDIVTWQLMGYSYVRSAENPDKGGLRVVNKRKRVCEFA